MAITFDEHLQGIPLKVAGDKCGAQLRQPPARFACDELNCFVERFVRSLQDTKAHQRVEQWLFDRQWYIQETADKQNR